MRFGGLVASGLLTYEPCPTPAAGRMMVAACRAAPPTYNDFDFVYNAGMAMTSYVMTVSRNGQVSIPADTRARWQARRVVVVDLGDRVVMRPLPDDGVEELEGKYGGRGPTSDEARRRARREESARPTRR